MDCSWPEIESTAFFGFDRRKDAAEELVRGREFAQQLGGVLRSSGGGAASASGQDLLSRILTSFSNTLSILNRSTDSSDDINSSVIINNSPRKSEESGDSINCKTRPGCYKRRKRSHSWARESGNLVDDGHAWRKYGQKVILHATYPRNYYRCTHKYDQSCQATKQVQQVHHNPPKFRTTYYGNHTCTNFLKPSEIVLGAGGCSNFNDSGGVLLCFDTADQPTVKKEQQQLHVIGSSTTATDNNSNNNNNNVYSPSDYISEGPSPTPDHLSVLDFDNDDDALQFHF